MASIASRTPRAPHEKSRPYRAGFSHAKCRIDDSLVSRFGGFLRIGGRFSGGLAGCLGGLGSFFSYLFSSLDGFFGCLDNFLGYLFSGLGCLIGCLAGCLSCFRSLIRRLICSFRCLASRILGLLAAHHGANNRED